jgi:hypothetical protein
MFVAVIGIGEKLYSIRLKEEETNLEKRLSNKIYEILSNLKKKQLHRKHHSDYYHIYIIFKKINNKNYN